MTQRVNDIALSFLLLEIQYSCKGRLVHQHVRAFFEATEDLQAHKSSIW
jgi:hypothetical protein